MGAKATTTASRHNQAAVGYVGTNKREGLEQLKILIDAGLKPPDTVLEIGCGCLMAGRHIIKYLNDWNYTGVDPNRWLWQYSIADKSAFCFDFVDFQAPGKYDYMISHSVLSHASTGQVKTFFENCSMYLIKKGFVSLHFAKNGRKTDWDKWQYPAVTFHGQNYVQQVANEYDLHVKLRPDLTERIVKVHSSSTHDWIEITPIK